MAKIAIGIAEIAGAVLLDVFSDGIASFLDSTFLNGVLANASTFVDSVSLAMGTMGVGMTLSGIGDLLQSSGAGIQTSARSSNAARVTIYGQSRVAGNCVYSGSDANHTYNQVIVWASHPVESIDHIYIDNKEWYAGKSTGEGHRDDDASHYDAAGVKYSFSNRTYVCSFTGSTSGHWYRDLGKGLDGTTTADSNWSSSCTLNNMATSYVACRYDPDVFSSFPIVTAVIKGKSDIYDPRLGDRLNADGSVNNATHTYTTNAALIIADFMTNEEYGVGIEWNSIDLTQLIAAANVCDETVPLASGSGGANTSGTSWVANRQYAVGSELSVSVDGTSYLQQVTTAVPVNGVCYSGSTQPAWPTTTGASVTDGCLTWTCQGVTPVDWKYTTVGEARYSINGSFQWSSTPGEILSSLLDACEGRLTYVGGKWQIWPAAWWGSTLLFDQSDLVDSVKETSNRKMRDLINCVRSEFVCPAYPYNVVGYDKDHPDTNVYNGCWQITDAPEYACDALHGYGSDIYMAQDGGNKLPISRRYQFVTSVSQVQRLSKIYLLRNRYQGQYTLSMNLSAYQTIPTDVIQMTFPALSWTNKYLEVTSLKFAMNQQSSESSSGNAAPALYLQLECCETDLAVYEWSVAEEMTQEARQSPLYWLSNVVTDPTSLTLESDSTIGVTGTDGIYTPRVLVSWIEPNDAYVTTGGHIEVQWYFDDTPSVVHSSGLLAGDTTNYYITGCKQGQGVTVQIRASHADGAAGNWVL